MKLPISIFPNVTEYTRANWTGYLKPAHVKLDSYSIPDKPKPYTTVTQRPDGLIVIKKKGGTTFAVDETNVSGLKLTVSGIPANSKMVILHELTEGAADWKTGWKKGTAYSDFSKGTTLDDSADAQKLGCHVTALTDVLSGTKTFKLGYGWECSHTVYIAFYDADRLDACLSGN